MSGVLVPRSDVGEFRRRYKWMALAAFLAFAGIVVRLFQLEVVNGVEYAAIAHENIIRRVTLATTRGIIRDANGKIIASSRPAYNVEIIPGRVMPSARPVRMRQGRPVQREPDSFPKIADALRLNPDERAHFEARIHEACVDDEDRWVEGRRIISPCWHPILVREDVARDIVSELKQHTDELGGVSVSENAVRFYPYKNLGSHMLGYIAEIDPEALSKFRPDGANELSAEERQKLNPLGYEPGDYIGATGIEHTWESYLRGQRGWEKRVVDAHGTYRSGPDAERLIDAPRRQDPLPGRDLRLSIDIELEKAIDIAMRPHPSGAVVAIDVRSGRILALYSKPDFDPNDLSGGAGRQRVREAFNRLYPDPYRPMLDKTMSGAFPPGSTFKAFAAMAALENHSINPELTHRCDGYITFGRQILHCSHTHGDVNLREALAQSCNIYFFALADATGLDPMAKVASDFGLGARTGLGVSPEAAGRIPTRAWYALRFKGQGFRKGFALNAAIGQGDVTVTPLQLALAYAAIGNGGTLYQPQIVRAVETPDGTVAQEFPPRVRRQVSVRPENIARVVAGLYDVVNNDEGTAFGARESGLDIAGKTGTAQTGYHAKRDDDPKMSWWRSRAHAWFASFAPAKAPEIAVVVLVEHGESGPLAAAPVAIKIYEQYFKLKAERAGTPPLGSAAAPAPKKP